MNSGNADYYGARTTHKNPNLQSEMASSYKGEEDDA